MFCHLIMIGFSKLEITNLVIVWEFQNLNKQQLMNSCKYIDQVWMLALSQSRVTPIILVLKLSFNKEAINPWDHTIKWGILTKLGNQLRKVIQENG